MLTVRRSADPERPLLPWHDNRHTFSFGEYHDPDHMGLRTLRVLNDDRVRAEERVGAQVGLT